MLGRVQCRTVLEAVARYTVFLHPETVEQTNGEALFRITRTRDSARRGCTIERPDGSKVSRSPNSASSEMTSNEQTVLRCKLKPHGAAFRVALDEMAKDESIENAERQWVKRIERDLGASPVVGSELRGRHRRLRAF